MERSLEIVELMDLLKDIAIRLQPVASAFDGDVYSNWNSSEIKYGSVNFGLERVEYDIQFCKYHIIMYYGDRLLQDASNRNDIYSDGIRVLQTIINAVNMDDRLDIDSISNYTPFEQTFADYLAGVYCRVEILAPSILGVCDDMFNVGPTYEQIDYEGLIITSLSDYNNIGMRFHHTSNPFFYSYNGVDWISFTINTKIPLNKGQQVAIKSTGSGQQTANSYTILDITKDSKISGDLSHLYEGSFKNKTLYAHQFRWLFSRCYGLVDAGDLVLPELPLTVNCYYGLFNNCCRLEKAPKLPHQNSTTAAAPYTDMLYGCSVLKEIYAVIPPNSGTNSVNINFSEGVPVYGGKFYKMKGVEWTNGIPLDWQVIDVEYPTITTTNWSRGYEAGLNAYLTGISTLSVLNDEEYNKGYQRGMEDAKSMEENI